MSSLCFFCRFFIKKIIFELLAASCLCVLCSSPRSVEEYIPGMSFLLGFGQRHDANPANEVSASLVRESPATFDIEVKTPQVATS